MNRAEMQGSSGDAPEEDPTVIEIMETECEQYPIAESLLVSDERWLKFMQDQLNQKS